MYTIIISVLMGVAIGVGYTLLGFWQTWAMGIILGVLVILGAFVLISRLLAKRIEPLFMNVQKQIQSGANQAALKSLGEMLPMARWQIMMAGQIHAQMGLLAYAMDKDDVATGHLEKSGHRVAEARLTLAALQYRRKQVDKALETMDFTIRTNKKQILPYHVHAYLLNKEGKRDDAIATLQRALKVEASNDSTKDNLQRLQNNKKMNMKRFGMQWYALKLEKPPAAMRQGHPGGMRRGFRAKKQRGR